MSAAVMNVEDSVLVKKVKEAFRDQILDTVVFRGEVTHLVETAAVRNLCNFLRIDPDLRMNYIVDVVGADYFGENPRFEVVYHLYSIQKKHRIRVKVRVNEGETVPSVTSIWPGANWPEREAYDMFGIVFDGHPNMKRIYMAEDWEGYPLRKDYPLRGYKDRYNPNGVEKEPEGITD
ncbi:MAG: NADH-quinone oxidoreductase subunit C [Deltaproteobacteria bacterium]|nr:NADH-quinone oxidoreductase subunit C [Deltaproteobacteria bacterium]